MTSAHEPSGEFPHRNIHARTHVEQFDGPPQRAEKLSNSSTGCPNARRSFRTVRRAIPTLGEAFELFDGLSQRSEKPSNCSTGCPNARRSFRTVRRAVPTLREAFELFDGLSQCSEKPSNCSTGCPNARRSFRTVRRAERTPGKASERQCHCHSYSTLLNIWMVTII